MNWYDKLLEKLGLQDKKKLVQNTAVIIILGIVFIIAGSTFFKSGKVTQEDREPLDNANVREVSKLLPTDDKGEMERKVESILSQIKGAGKVSVMITYVSGKEAVIAYDQRKNENDTQEKDSGGGARNIRQNDEESNVAYQDEQGGGKKPIVVKELQPAARGVVIVAEGASDEQVKEKLCRAVQSLLEVPLHRIQVFERQ
jgi:stage III sporulation protein AG